MSPDERSDLLAAAIRMLEQGALDEFADSLDDAGLTEEFWSDPEVAGAILASSGRLCAPASLWTPYFAVTAGTPEGVAVVLPAPGGTQPPGHIDPDGLIRVDGLVGHAGLPLLVHVGADQSIVVPAGALVHEEVGGFDPTLGLDRVRGALSRETPVENDAEVWAQVCTALSFAVAYGLLGTANAALSLAIEHAGQRHQFGRPISAFQAVRHRLAMAKVDLLGAECLLATLSADPSPAVAALARVEAGRAATGALAQAQQVCGAMGFTAEFGLHRWVRRVYALDGLLGPHESGLEEIGRSLLVPGGRRTPSNVVGFEEQELVRV